MDKQFKRYCLLLSLVLLGFNPLFAQNDGKNYYFVNVNAMLTALQGTDISNVKCIGLGFGYEINKGIFYDFPLSLSVEYDIFSNEEEFQVNRLGFTLFPQISLVDSEGFLLSVGPKIKLHQQYAKLAIEYKPDAPIAEANSSWHLALAPVIQGSIFVTTKDDDFNKISFGIFWDPNSLGKSLNRLRYQGEPVFERQVKTQQIGLMLGYYFR